MITGVTSGPAVPEHVFLSFSRKDNETAQFIFYTLWRNGIRAWIDYANLIPGTPDWEAEIRDAIKNAFAVVVLASPESRESKYVRGELSVAESRGCQIFPLWIEGVDWADSIPLGLTYTQYIDARDTRRDEGIATLCNTLQEHIRKATPKHYCVSPLRRMVGHKRFTHVYPPPGFISVEIAEEDEGRLEEGGKAAFFRISEYTCVQALLDELYMEYLKDRFEPYTYGTRWILEETFGSRPFTGGRLLLVPWSWLVGQSSGSEMERDWFLNKQPAERGMKPGTYWRISDPAEVSGTGLAVNDESVYLAFRTSTKAIYYLRKYGILVDQPLDEVGDHYSIRHVISTPHRLLFNEEVTPHAAMIQTDKALPEKEIKYWLEICSLTG